MGAGISQKDLRRKLYNALQSQKRDLRRAGVPTFYKNLQLFPVTTGRTTEFEFNISYRVLRASNGETAAQRIVKVNHNGETREWGRDWDSDKGIRYIIENWSRGEKIE